LSVYLFLRGHSAPGGGFIAALVAGIAITFGWMAHGRIGGRVPVIRSMRSKPLIGAGLITRLAGGLAAIVVGAPFLTPVHTSLGVLSLSSSMLFGLGVYLVVTGLVVAVVDRLGGLGPAVAHQLHHPTESLGARGRR